MAQKELILKDNYIYRKALMQNHDLEIQEVNGEATMTAGEPEKADTRQVGAVFFMLHLYWSESESESENSLWSLPQAKAISLGNWVTTH